MAATETIITALEVTRYVQWRFPKAKGQGNEWRAGVARARCGAAGLHHG